MVPIHNKTHLMTLPKLSKSRQCSFIQLSTETQHFFHDQALCDSGKKQKCLLTGRNLEHNQTQT